MLPSQRSLVLQLCLALDYLRLHRSAAGSSGLDGDPCPHAGSDGGANWSPRDNDDIQVIDHDDVAPIDGDADDDEWYWQPWLSYGSGACVEYPAVDYCGRVSGGLKPRGGTNSGCRHNNTPQGYVRRVDPAKFDLGGERRSMYMYAWYFPKNEHLNWISKPQGTRHSWQYAMLLVLNANASASFDGYLMRACYSGADAMSCHYDNPVQRVYPGASDPPTLGNLPTGMHAQVDYRSDRDGWGHSSGYYLTRSAQQHGYAPPLVDWDRMPARARKALQVYDWGSGVRCPLNDANFPHLVRQMLKGEVVKPSDDDDDKDGGKASS